MLKNNNKDYNVCTIIYLFLLPIVTKLNVFRKLFELFYEKNLCTHFDNHDQF